MAQLSQQLKAEFDQLISDLKLKNDGGNKSQVDPDEEEFQIILDESDSRNAKKD